MSAIIRPWKPRASSIGNYIRCEWRALQDRLIDDGSIPAPMRLPSSHRKPRESPNAALGNCEHFVLQDGIRCEFGPRDTRYLDFDKIETAPFEQLSREEKEFVEYCRTFFDNDIDATEAAYKAGESRIYQPLPSEWKYASELFGNSLEVTQQKVREVALLGASKVPTTPDGKPWLSETELENDILTGHTDFLSQCRTVVGDLKTTARPMTHAWIKYEHLAQMASYHILTNCKKTWVLYLDSMRAAWSVMVWIDWTLPGMQRYAEQVADFCKLLMSDKIFDVAMPRLGEHCSSTWCAYHDSCYSEMMPPKGILFDATASKRATGTFSWGAPKPA